MILANHISTHSKSTSLSRSSFNTNLPNPISSKVNNPPSMPMEINSVGKPTECGCGNDYCRNLEPLRKEEYPYLKKSVYLEHAGTTLYAASLVKSFARKMRSDLYGNPHSMSSSSRRSTKLIDDVRFRALAFFNADPNEYDLVFVANATSAIKLVAESFRDFKSCGFQYGYHVDSHTSLVGMRELATNGYQCLGDRDVVNWISEHCSAPSSPPTLFAFPAQSNLNGRRLPVQWCQTIRTAAGKGQRQVFSLLDAASFVSTAPLDVSKIGPDFVALSFYKIFGFPDLGALIVRKDAVHALDARKFFGGGTVDMVIASGDKWHARKQTSIHDRFEDGTLPFHNIIALGVALCTHERLYGSMSNVSIHTGWLAKEAFDRLSSLRHFNGTKVCQIYRSEYGNTQFQGPIIPFNLRNSRGDWIPKTEVEKMAATRDIQLRSGSVCNPGGTASSLGWTHTDLRRLYTAGLRCGDDHDVLDGRPTGVLRVSLGAMTSLDDIQALVHFIRDTYVENAPDMNHLVAPLRSSKFFAPEFFVQTLTVFPILGCDGFSIPMGERWEIHDNGLAWNHAWCLVHETTNEILESHIYPRMLKIRPTVQLNQRVLHLSCPEWTGPDQFNIKISLPVARPKHSTVPLPTPVKHRQDILRVQKYEMTSVTTFFSKVVGVPCTLAMFCSPSTSQIGPLSLLGGTYKGRLRSLFRRKASWSRLSCTKPGSDDCSSWYPVENCTVTFRSRVQCESVASSSEAENENLIQHSVACRPRRANIMLGKETARSTNENSPFTQYDWSAIRIGPDQVLLGSMPNGASDKCKSLEPSVISKSETLSVRHLNGRIVKYEVRPAEEDNNSRRTIAVGDVILPVG